VASAVPAASLNPRSVDIVAGIALVLSAILSLIAILHHPTLATVQGAEEAARAIHSLAAMDKLVHGALMAIFSVQAIGFYYFSARLGFDRPAILAGFMAYALGTIILFIPTTLDGFVTPDLNDACMASPNCGTLPSGVIGLIAIAIQDFTMISLVATSSATLSWSTALVRFPGWMNRAAGCIGFACGVAPLAVFGFFSVYLRPDNLAAIVLAPLIWTLTAGALMFHQQTRP
jgi:hypothetical protein